MLFHVLKNKQTKTISRYRYICLFCACFCSEHISYLGVKINTEVSNACVVGRNIGINSGYVIK